MEKIIKINSKKTDYTLDEYGVIRSHKYNKVKQIMYKTKIYIYLDYTNKYVYVKKVFKQLFPELKEFKSISTKWADIQKIRFNTWYNIPKKTKEEFYDFWEILENNKYMNTSYLLETNKSDQMFRKVKRV